MYSIHNYCKESYIFQCQGYLKRCNTKYTELFSDVISTWFELGSKWTLRLRSQRRPVKHGGGGRGGRHAILNSMLFIILVRQNERSKNVGAAHWLFVSLKVGRWIIFTDSESPPPPPHPLYPRRVLRCSCCADGIVGWVVGGGVALLNFLLQSEKFSQMFAPFSIYVCIYKGIHGTTPPIYLSLYTFIRCGKVL